MNVPYTIWTNKFCIPASEEAKKELFDKMEETGYKWNANTLELEKLEPKFKEGYDKDQHKLVKQEFKPFEKVLVRDDTNKEWSIDLFSYYDEENKNFPYVCMHIHYRYCIPYEGNEYLLGTTNDIKN